MTDKEQQIEARVAALEAEVAELKRLLKKPEGPMNQAAGLPDWELARMGIRRDPNVRQDGVRGVQTAKPDWFFGSNSQPWETTPKG